MRHFRKTCSVPPVTTATRPSTPKRFDANKAVFEAPGPLAILSVCSFANVEKVADLGCK